MQIVYDSVITDADKLNIIRLANECGILYDTARLLYCKKIDTKEKITAFLNPSKKGFLNPFNLSGVSEAIDLIYNAKLKGLGVLIFGDYDADGVCATTIMKLALEEYGINANCVVPERHEGYGLNLEKIERLKQTMPIDLIITVDCGISDKDKIEVLKEWGITVIVTDHHEPPEDLPNCIKINPKLDKEKYGFTGLSGAGVAYKLSRALIGEKADKYLDFVAVSTIADSMELIDENRDLVAEGVKLLNDKKRLRKCFVPFLKEKNQKITASSLSYTLIPKINAGGRFGDAETVLKLFLSKDENEIFDLSSKLLEYNLSRQQEAEKIYLDARRKIQQENLAGDGIITLVSEEWQSGFVGLVASRLSDEFCRPIIVFGMQDGEYKGSARTYGEVNILEAITDSKHLLKTFGGHRQAAGLTVLKENFLALRKRLNEYMLRVYPNFNFDKQIHVEWKMESAPSMLFAKELECFEPFGVGNKKPIFSIECNKLNVSFIRSNNAHLNIEAKGFPLTYWKGGVDYEKLIQPINKELVFELETTEFQGKEWCRGIVRSVSYDYGDYSELKHYILENVLLSITEKDIDAYGVVLVDELPLNDKTYGTIYALSNYNNLEKYPQLKGLPISLGKPLHKNYNNCIVVALKEPLEGYERVVYLDEPLHYVEGFNESYLVKNVKGYDVSELSTERSDFVAVYVELDRLLGKNFTSINNLYDQSRKEVSREQFVFSTIVFMELGIYYSKEGVLKRDANAKSPLTNSFTYSKICSVK